MIFVNIFFRVLASRKFFIFVVALLVFQALWLVFSFRYPMLWDEYYHFGLIQYYGHHLSPFITNQPTSLDIYGQVERIPKYLYHFLMGFPYRLVDVFTANQTIQVIVLRILNIAMFAGGLFAYRAVMLRITKSRALVHFILFVLVLLPLSSLMAAQINYDNLQFLLTGLVLYWALRFIQAGHTHQPACFPAEPKTPLASWRQTRFSPAILLNSIVHTAQSVSRRENASDSQVRKSCQPKQFEVKWLFLIIGVGLLAVVAKYTFMPVLAAVGLVLAYWIIKQRGKQSLRLAIESFGGLGKWSKVGLVLLVLVGAGLFVERIGVNVVRYHAINPACNQVISHERCLSFSPYASTLGSDFVPDPAKLQSPVEFTFTTWASTLFHQYFTSGTRLAHAYYTVPEPLIVPYTTGAVMTILGILAFLAYGWRIWRRPEIMLLVLSILALAAALWLINYPDYKKYGFPWAIQGRYMLPVVPLGMLLAGISLQKLLPWRLAKVGLATIAIVGLLYGGGLFTHIFASKTSWYWHNHTVDQINSPASRFLDGLPGFYKINQ